MRLAYKGVRMAKKNMNTTSLDKHLIREEDQQEQHERVQRLRQRLDRTDLQQGAINAKSEKSEARKLRESGQVKNYYPPSVNEGESLADMRKRLSEAFGKQK